MSLFKKKSKKSPTWQEKPVKWPTDSFVETEAETYLIKGNTKIALFSDRVIQSWSVTPLLGTEASLADHVLKKGYLGFRNGTLVKSISGEYYLISENKSRRITNPDVFTLLNLDRENALEVSDEELNLHPEGEVLS